MMEYIRKYKGLLVLDLYEGKIIKKPYILTAKSM